MWPRPPTSQHCFFLGTDCFFPSILQLHLLLVEIVFFNRIARKAFQRPTYERLWSDKMYLWCLMQSQRNVPRFPISHLHLSCCGKNPVLCSLKARNRAPVQTFCTIGSAPLPVLIRELSLFPAGTVLRSMQSAPGPRQLLGPHGYCGESVFI